METQNLSDVQTQIYLILINYINYSTLFMNSEDNLEKKYDEMNDILQKNTLYILKMAVLDEQLPLTDRLHAGELYMDLGGNGAVKKKYQELLKECN